MSSVSEMSCVTENCISIGRPYSIGRLSVGGVTQYAVILDSSDGFSEKYGATHSNQYERPNNALVLV